MYYKQGVHRRHGRLTRPHFIDTRISPRKFTVQVDFHALTRREVNHPPYNQLLPAPSLGQLHGLTAFHLHVLLDGRRQNAHASAFIVSPASPCFIPMLRYFEVALLILQSNTGSWYTYVHVCVLTHCQSASYITLQPTDGLSRILSSFNGAVSTLHYSGGFSNFVICDPIIIHNLYI
jgi:hypothetical protein